mgnify:CR=1 FL=1
MARYEHLPIYRKSFELAVYLEQVTAGFSKRHKYALGTRIQDAAQAVLCRVVRAQNTGPAERESELRELRLEVEVMKNLLHLGKEVQAFKSFNAYHHAAELAVDVGRQTEGWLKSSLVPRSPESRPTNPQGSRS